MFLMAILYFLYISLAVFLLVVIFAMFYTIFPTLLFLGGPYIVTKEEHSSKMIELANPKQGEKMLDLGSGDGRIVIAFAKLGIMSYGYEVNPYLIKISREEIKKQNLSQNAFISYKNFWKADISGFDVVTIYPAGFMLKRLEEKLIKELKPGARVVLNGFIFPNWKYKDSDGRLFLYEKTLI